MSIDNQIVVSSDHQHTFALIINSRQIVVSNEPGELFDPEYAKLVGDLVNQGKGYEALAELWSRPEKLALLVEAIGPEAEINIAEVVRVILENQGLLDSQA